MTVHTDEMAAAEQVLLETVAMPVFAEKLAANGVVWRNADEFAMLDAMAAQLYADVSQQEAKQASEVSPFLQHAYASVFGSQPATADRAVTAAAAAGVREHAQLKQAALTYYNHLAAQAS